MDERQLRELIGQIVAELLGQRSGAPRRNALVLFTGALLGFEAALDSLRRLLPQVNLDWTQTPSAERILDQQAIASVGMTRAADSLVAAHDLLIIPTMTVNLAAKVSHGIGDCLASNVVAEFVMMNKPVIVATNAACPDSADKRGWFPELPEGYAQVLRANLATLSSFGVGLASAERLDRAVLKALDPAAASSGSAIECAERVIHEGLVTGLEPGSLLRISRTALVTALAREAAASRDITIERMD